MNNSGLICAIEEVHAGLDQALKKISYFVEVKQTALFEFRKKDVQTTDPKIFELRSEILRLERLSSNIQAELNNLKKVRFALRAGSEKSMFPEFIAHINDMSAALLIINLSQRDRLERAERENKILIDDQSAKNPLIRWADDVQTKGRELLLSALV